MSDVQSISVTSSMLFKPSATPEYQKNPARWIYERLVEAVENFEKDLPNNMQAGGILTSFNGQIFSIDALGYWTPDIIIFSGALQGLNTDSHTQLFQHISQLNLLLVAVSRTDDTSKPRRKIGFVTPAQST